MPAFRNNIWDLVNNPTVKSGSSKTAIAKAPLAIKTVALPPPTNQVLYPGHIPTGSDDIHYPTSEVERQLYCTSAGKRLTPHQWAVYDYILNIPVGRVSTYKIICESLGQGSPRSVGSALRNNPFAPYIPCHRVIASNMYLGGFCGEWGPESKTGIQFGRKLNILAEEGVDFDSRGMLKSSDNLWRPE